MYACDALCLDIRRLCLSITKHAFILKIELNFWLMPHTLSSTVCRIDFMYDTEMRVFFHVGRISIPGISLLVLYFSCKIVSTTKYQMLPYNPVLPFVQAIIIYNAYFSENPWFFVRYKIQFMPLVWAHSLPYTYILCANHGALPMKLCAHEIFQIECSGLTDFVFLMLCCLLNALFWVCNSIVWNILNNKGCRIFWTIGCIVCRLADFVRSKIPTTHLLNALNVAFETYSTHFFRCNINGRPLIREHFSLCFLSIATNLKQ